MSDKKREIYAGGKSGEFNENLADDKDPFCRLLYNVTDKIDQRP